MSPKYVYHCVICDYFVLRGQYQYNQVKKHENDQFLSKGVKGSIQLTRYMAIPRQPPRRFPLFLQPDIQQSDVSVLQSCLDFLMRYHATTLPSQHFATV